MSSVECVQTLLQELAKHTKSAPGHSVDGTPREIVEGVVSRSSRFGRFSEDAVRNLERQLVMAIKAQGHRFHLAVRPLHRGRVEVSLVG